MPIDAGTGLIAHAIQLAIAPVFLLTGIAALLGVMATRLARVIDRARSFEHEWADLAVESRAAAQREIAMLEQRRRVCSWSINCCTAAALLICLVIVALFVDEMLATDLKLLSGVLFVLAMILLIGGLSCFLREVYLATHTITFDASRFR
ncbi:MAG: DUF2721 domain-containing protein [Pseudomonadota bacterium]|nr:DUF2721 domain-containing protein [Pseudomonadota bacterium]